MHVKIKNYLKAVINEHIQFSHSKSAKNKYDSLKFKIKVLILNINYGLHCKLLSSKQTIAEYTIYIHVSTPKKFIP